MVAVAQAAEHPDVARKVVGSKPIGHPMKIPRSCLLIAGSFVNPACLMEKAPDF